MKRYIKGLALLAFLAGALANPIALRQALSEPRPDGLRSHCARTAVKISINDDQGKSTSGSGAFIDSRGYVLTSFHLVGIVDPSEGVPGNLRRADNQFLIANASEAEDPARTRWIASVVRASVPLDLALLRIVSDVGGAPTKDVRYPSVELSTSHSLDQDSSVWTCGFSRGSRIAEVKRTSIRQVMRNVFRQISWLLLQDEENPGEAGGMLLDEVGRLVGVLNGDTLPNGHDAVRWARPVSRVPQEWTDTLRRGDIFQVRVEGAKRLTLAMPMNGLALGDHQDHRKPERQFYLAPLERPCRIEITPAFPMLVTDAHGRMLRQGKGAVDIALTDMEEIVLAVDVDGNSTEATTYTLRVSQPQGSAPSTISSSPTPTKRVPIVFAPRTERAHTPSQGSDPFFFDIGPTYVPSTSGPGEGWNPLHASIVGTVVDALTGRPIAGATIVAGRPGADIGTLMQSFLRGDISERQFQMSIVARGSTGLRGRFELLDLPLDRTYPLAAFASGYRVVVLTVRIRKENVVNVPRIELVH